MVPIQVWATNIKVFSLRHNAGPISPMLFKKRVASKSLDQVSTCLWLKDEEFLKYWSRDRKEHNLKKQLDCKKPRTLKFIGLMQRPHQNLTNTTCKFFSTKTWKNKRSHSCLYTLPKSKEDFLYSGFSIFNYYAIIQIAFTSFYLSSWY